MEWLETLGQVVSGGALGTIGGIFTKWMDGRHELAMEKIKADERQKERDHDLETMKFEATSAENLAIIKANGEERVADISGMVASINAEAKGATWSKGWADKLSGAWACVIAFLLGLVDVVRGSIRPWIVASLTLFMMWFMKVSLNKIPDHQATELFIGYIGKVLDMTIFLWGVSVGWYFSSRPQNRNGMALKSY